MKRLFALFFVFLLSVSSAYGQEWHVGTEMPVEWDAVTTLTDGSDVPPGDVVGYAFYLTDFVTDPDKSSPSLIDEITGTQYTVSLDPFRWHLVGVQAIRRTSLGIEVSRSTIAWSDDPVSAPEPFGIQRLPLVVHTIPDGAAYGNIPGGDQTQKNEVHYTFPAIAGIVTVNYEIYDTDTSTEVEILINGNHAGYAFKSGDKNWSPVKEVGFGDPRVFDNGINVVTFSNTNNPPENWPWGVRNLTSADFPPVGSTPPVEPAGIRVPD